MKVSWGGGKWREAYSSKPLRAKRERAVTVAAKDVQGEGRDTGCFCGSKGRLLGVATLKVEFRAKAPVTRGKDRAAEGGSEYIIIGLEN